MTISAVSSVTSYSYSTAVENQYFGTSISESQLQILMDRYMIKQTGDSEIDLRALYNAMYPEASSKAQSSSASASTNQSQKTQSGQENQAIDAQNANNVPWANLMNQVGLYATGDMTKDYEAFGDKISQMQSSGATDSKMQATINQLVAEAAIVFVQPDDQSSAAQAQTSANNASKSQQVSGADIQAQINKMFVFGY